MPAALMAAAAAGEARNLNNALAASGLGAVARIPAEIAAMQQAGKLGSLTALAAKAAIDVTTGLLGADSVQVRVEVTVTPVRTG
jgi:hypothetical protein